MRIVFAAVAALLSGCTPVALVNALVPASGYSVQAGIAYGPLARQALDLYVPDADRFPGPRPVVVFFYGGTWQSGERGDYRFVGQALASRGFVAVVPDYRLYPQARYPGFMQDAARALAWTKREIGARGGDPAHVVLMGHSAGAHIATMLAYNDRFLRAEGLARRDVRSVIGIAGPYDFVPTDPAVVALLTAEGPAADAMPTRYVRGGEPPTLLVTGEDDRTVSPGNTDRLVAKLKAAGSQVMDLRYPGLSHVMAVGRLAAPVRDEALLEAIAAFARR